MTDPRLLRGESAAGPTRPRPRRVGTWRPFEPWLFVQEGPDWAWVSYAEAAARAAGIASALAGLAPGDRVGFRDRIDPWSVACDCGVRAAGGTAVPVAAGGSAAAAAGDRGCAWWLAAPGEPAGDAPPALRRVVAPDPPPAAPEPTEAQLLLLGEGSGAGAVVAGEAAPEGGVRVTAAALAAAAAALDGSLEPPLLHAPAARLPRLRPDLRRCEGRRPVIVLHQPLERPLARLLLVWAVRRGAAIVLEPQAAALAATAAWVRPTLLAAASADLPRLRRAAEERRGRRRRPARPFGRLRALVVDARRPPSAGDAAFWEERGVAVVPVQPPGGVV